MKDREQIIAHVRKRYMVARDGLDERGRRQLVAAEALTIGWGGVRLVSEATGVARATITLGLKELRGQIPPAPEGKRRRPGGGRKALAAQDPAVVEELERLVEPSTREDRESPLRWTCKSTRQLADELAARGYRVSQEWVRQRLRDLHYTMRCGLAGALVAAGLLLLPVRAGQAATPATGTGAGGSWASAPNPDSGTNNTLFGVACPGARVCYAAGAGVLGTTDGGRTWRTRLATTHPMLGGIACPSVSVCYAVGDKGTIVATTDGGARWTRPTSGITTTLLSVACPSPSACVAVGANNTIVTTSDSGHTWTRRTDPDSAEPALSSVMLTAVSCPDVSHCHVVSDSGAAFVSNDGGTTWTYSGGSPLPSGSPACPARAPASVTRRPSTSSSARRAGSPGRWGVRLLPRRSTVSGVPAWRPATLSARAGSSAQRVTRASRGAPRAAGQQRTSMAWPARPWRPASPWEPTARSSCIEIPAHRPMPRS